VAKSLPGAWGLIMNAAPADFRPQARVSGKISKKGEALPELLLERTADILKAVAPGKGATLMVGFAAEPGDLVARAKEKLAAKNLDYIAANLAGGPGDTFESREISLQLLSSAGSILPIGPAPKFQAAWDLMSALAAGWR
jgi:phosphopantothenoylcysteine decarboxylase/phosphopantothenate--cysteine ligase